MAFLIHRTVQTEMIISSASVAVLVIHCAAIAVTDGVPLNQFFSYGESVGDTTLAKGDDENHPFVAKVPFLFYDKSFTMINVSHVIICVPAIQY